jgi:alpha-L-rhamnosidase
MGGPFFPLEGNDFGGFMFDTAPRKKFCDVAPRDMAVRAGDPPYNRIEMGARKRHRMFKAMTVLVTVLCAVLLFVFANSVRGSVMDTRGPVENAGMRVIADADGVQAPGYTWQDPPALSAWTAQWIGPPAAPKSIAACLRKVVQLKANPAKVTAWITGGNYLLWVNGHAAARGPADPGRDFSGTQSNHRFYDVRDITAFFHSGANALAVEIAGSGGFQLQASVEYPDGSSETIATDQTWRGIPCPYLLPATSLEPQKQKRYGKPIVVFDAAAEPLGWQSPDFNDQNWPPCHTGRPPDAMLVKSQLPPLMEAFYPALDVKPVSGDVVIPSEPFTPGHPVIVKGDGEFIVRFSRVMSGRCGLAVDGCAGAQVYLISSETEGAGGRLYWLKLRDGMQYFESRDYYALGVLRVVVRHAEKPIEIREVSADFLSQPVEYRGSFTCSDDALNTLWKSGRWSTQICMITHHLDSPHNQEPIGDYGDYLIADLVNFNAMGSNPWLARQDLQKWAWVMENAHYHTFHTSYVFYWLQSLLNYYDYTGDRSIIDDVAPQVHAMLDQYTTYLGKNGIISDAPNYMFMDWVTVHDEKNPKIAFPCHHPPAVIGQGYMTALYYRGLADGIRVAKLTKDPAQVNRYDRLRQQVAAAYEAELWNPARGQYRDGKPFVTSVKPGKWLPADVQMESFSVQNNAFAVLYDLAPAARREAVLLGMLKNPHWDVTPFFMHFVFDALADSDLFQSQAVAKMRDYVVVPQTQTVREMGANRGDYSHGWVASPTYQMSSKILGITPASPGFDAINIQPTFCNLAFARGVVPSHHGPIRVDWTRRPDQLSIKIDIPPGTTAHVNLDTGRALNPRLLLDDKPLAPATEGATGTASGVGSIQRDAGSLQFQLRPGSYQFSVRGLEAK